MTHLFLALIVGFGVGIVVGALGAGGGILSVPVLVYLLGQEPHAELRPDCWTLFIRIQAQTTVDALRNSSGVRPPSRIWRRLVFQWMM